MRCGTEDAERVPHWILYLMRAAKYASEQAMAVSEIRQRGTLRSSVERSGAATAATTSVSVIIATWNERENIITLTG
jgi:hypothetical protein